ncbi:hypothetical protein E2C01_102487 [Portunus trituberculatus]|uniref:Uncharacterized protein n=1 Tax=Portunus trituberculatus TaxID=210409 RepID=A0A5B7KDA7_PORTR|nr:hypothetical protein [Portunus trituberculatus]
MGGVGGEGMTWRRATREPISPSTHWGGVVDPQEAVVFAPFPRVVDIRWVWRLAGGATPTLTTPSRAPPHPIQPRHAAPRPTPPTTLTTPCRCFSLSLALLFPTLPYPPPCLSLSLPLSLPLLFPPATCSTKHVSGLRVREGDGV